MPYIIAVGNTDAHNLKLTPRHIEKICEGRIMSVDASIPGDTFYKMIGIVPRELPSFIEVIEEIPIESAVNQP